MSAADAEHRCHKIALGLIALLKATVLRPLPLVTSAWFAKVRRARSRRGRARQFPGSPQVGRPILALLVAHADFVHQDMFHRALDAFVEPKMVRPGLTAWVKGRVAACAFASRRISVARR